MIGRDLLAAARAVAFAVIWLALFVAWIRVVIGPMWGSASDLGLAGAVAATALGIVALTWVGLVMFRLVAAPLQQPTEAEKTDVEF